LPVGEGGFGGHTIERNHENEGALRDPWFDLGNISGEDGIIYQTANSWFWRHFRSHNELFSKELRVGRADDRESRKSCVRE